LETAHEADVRDLEKFGYKQELRRALGVYSSQRKAPVTEPATAKAPA
jgi:hypothetical protein